MTHSGTALIDPAVVFEKIALTAGMRVADLGCGRTGHFVFPASRRVGEQGIVYAVDVVKNVLESIASRARSEGFHNVQTVWSDIEQPGKTAIPTGSLDVCFLVNVLYLLKDKTAALKEATRFLKADGFLVVVEWRKNLGIVGPTTEMMVKPETLVAAVADLSVVSVATFPLGDYHYGTIYQNKNKI